MKMIITIARIIVGILFIFSGLVKANDPLGLSYKMEEFFDIWGMSQFNSWTLLLSVLMNAFEIIAGFALLLGWRIKLFSWLLLLLIVFFTFLTGYTYITGTPKNCGCFGDCLPITSKTSFLKDVVLTLLIGLLFWKQKYITPLFSQKNTTIIMLFITLFSFGFQWYTLNYLPVVDCLPYKKGNNISEKMKMPSNAVPDSIVITFVYEKEGKEIEFTSANFPDDFNSTTYKLIKRYDKVIREGKNNQPPIAGFYLSGDTKIDSTQIVLAQPYALLIFCENFSIPLSKWDKKFAALYTSAVEKNIPAYLITTQPATAADKIATTSFKDIPIFGFDDKALRTAARTNPTVLLLKEGTIIQKESYKKFENISDAVKQIPVQEKINEMPGTIQLQDSTIQQ